MDPSDRRHGDRFVQEIDTGGVPMGWVENSGTDGLSGIHVWIVSGAAVTRLCEGSRVVGSWFEDPYARYCRLAGLLPTNTSAPQDAQAAAVLQLMETTLQAGQMEFSHVIRTWFYNDSILAWYREFNAVRTRFFMDRGVFDGLLPASTGIAGRNAKAAALNAGLMAIKKKAAAVSVSTVQSPLQLPATKYGSSFSRAVELDLPDHRRLYVSGTASIDETGKTAFCGDVSRQVRKTMEVVEAILSSRDMHWDDVSRSIVYFKRAADAPLFDEYRTTHGLPSFPAITVESDVCRDDLLFEIELDAIKAR